MLARNAVYRHAGSGLQVRIIGRTPGGGLLDVEVLTTSERKAVNASSLRRISDKTSS